MQYFVAGSVAEPQTLFKDVHVLDAGHYLVWEKGALRKHRYWQAHFTSEPMPCEEAVREVRSALLDSMKAHFESDVPVGLFLSGGIDSTAIAALAGLVGRRDLATFSIGVDDDKLDESGAARRTAAHFGTRHQELRLNADTAKKSFGEFLTAMDQPTIDGFNTFTVAAFAREQGMKVVLSGLGGDEMFGGYKSFDAVPRLHQWSRLAGTIPGLRNGLGGLLERLPYSHKARRIGSLLRSEGTVRDAHLCFRGIYSRHEARLLAAGYLGCDPRDIQAGPPPHVHATDARDAVSECELRFYMRNQLLKDSDVMSMAHGLELRVPLVDHFLFQRVSRVPAEWRLRKGKRMLLEALPEIPEWVAAAPKRGFVFPFERWIAEGWGEDFARAGGRTPFANATWYQKWSIFVLDHWLARL
jgi:asparagine synthase (glutamine-hydrolysing)